MATFTPVQMTKFCEPDATMPFGKEMVELVKDVRIALPTITGTPTMALPADTRYRIEVHIPGRTSDLTPSP